MGLMSFAMTQPDADPSAPFAFNASKACVVFEPGDAHKSNTRWCGSICKIAAGTIESTAWRVNTPVLFVFTSHLCKSLSIGLRLNFRLILSIPSCQPSHHARRVGAGMTRPLSSLVSRAFCRNVREASRACLTSSRLLAILFILNVTGKGVRKYLRNSAHSSSRTMC